MTDEKIERLKRKAAETGSHRDLAALWHARVRAGIVCPHRNLVVLQIREAGEMGLAKVEATCPNCYGTTILHVRDEVDGKQFLHASARANDVGAIIFTVTYTDDSTEERQTRIYPDLPPGGDPDAPSRLNDKEWDAYLKGMTPDEWEAYKEWARNA